uniref:Ig-like domain-containing protein n=1 Tax=Scophthalmus maximus TaxID=52904 RepID=A0A8D3BWN9_SCOMX
FRSKRVYHTANSFSVSGVSQSVLITQWPHYISRLPSGSAEMSCYQNDTDYDYMYWYRQLRGGEIQLVGYLVAGSANYEAGFQSGFEAAKSQEKQWSLKIASVQREDEAVYLCAASLHSAAYFGGGTKLTVLEYDVKPPVVKVLGPSSRECRNLKDNERRKTLLCVASDFYPDHVSVSWRVGGQEVSRGVATDNAALRQGENYKITSRLRVSAEDWFKPETEFERPNSPTACSSSRAASTEPLWCFWCGNCRFVKPKRSWLHLFLCIFNVCILH